MPLVQSDITGICCKHRHIGKKQGSCRAAVPAAHFPVARRNQIRQQHTRWRVTPSWRKSMQSGTSAREFYCFDEQSSTLLQDVLPHHKNHWIVKLYAETETERKTGKGQQTDKQSPHILWRHTARWQCSIHTHTHTCTRSRAAGDNRKYCAKNTGKQFDVMRPFASWPLSTTTSKHKIQKTNLVQRWEVATFEDQHSNKNNEPPKSGVSPSQSSVECFTLGRMYIAEHVEFVENGKAHK